MRKPRWRAGHVERASPPRAPRVLASLRALIVTASFATGGCSNLLGLNDLQDVDCVGASCADAAVDGSVAADSSVADTLVEDSVADTLVEDSVAETTVEDSAAETGGTDSMSDSASAADGGDSGGCKEGPSACGACDRACSTTNVATQVCTSGLCKSTCVSGWGNCITLAAPTPDDGCETRLDTITNCGGCGNVCSSATGTPSCSGTSCTYACNLGRGDCNSATSPNTDGCECVSSSTAATGTVGGCCAGGCQTQHDNGVGQNFYDCVAVSTYNSTQALEACKAYTNDPTGTNCHSFSCTGGGSNQVMCNDAGGKNCACWNFSGSNVGHVYLSSSTGCACPTASSTAWK